MKLFYYSRDDKNFGDSIGPEIVSWLLGKPVQTVNGFTNQGTRPSSGGNLVALGSIFHMVGRGDVISGTESIRFTRRR